MITKNTFFVTMPHVPAIRFRAFMRLHRFLYPICLVTLLSSFCLPFPTAPPGVFDDCKQLVVVVSPKTASVKATLLRYEKHGKSWKQIGAAIPVNLGRKGLAWGRGLHSAKSGVQKKEGDQKSPAGLFRFGTAFGYAPEADVPFKLPYVSVTPTQICVEDSASIYYNQIVDETQVTKDWKTRESMLRQDEQYKWGIFVKHNLPPEPGSGSCIFFHIWRKEGSGTLGCTAMAEENLLELMQWLDPAQKPLLIQMVKKDYEGYRKRFRLPQVK
jgi:D-alanyl-D-alanine dipeptidase